MLFRGKPDSEPERTESAAAETIEQNSDAAESAEAAVGEPVVDGPAADGPIENERAADEPVAGEPAADEPVVGEALESEPVAGEQAAGGQSAADEAVAQPVWTQPFVREVKFGIAEYDFDHIAAEQQASAVETAEAAPEPAAFYLTEEPGFESDEAQPVPPYLAGEPEPVLDEAAINETIEQLCESKAEEFRLLGYEQVTGSDVWECVNDSYNKGFPPLYAVVNDILSLKITKFMNFITLSMYRVEPRK